MTFSPFAQAPNELSAAHLVDEVASDPRAAKLISFLDNEPFPKLPGDLEKIAGPTIPNQNTGSVNQSSRPSGLD
jgi:hypothetical protein